MDQQKCACFKQNMPRCSIRPFGRGTNHWEITHVCVERSDWVVNAEGSDGKCTGRSSRMCWLWNDNLARKDGGAGGAEGCESDDGLLGEHFDGGSNWYVGSGLRLSYEWKV